MYQWSKVVRSSRADGFSFVEIMVALAIMCILAIVAALGYIKFQMRVRETEVHANLDAIRAFQVAYRAESEAYMLCPANPANIPTQTVAWPGGLPGWQDIGFEPDGKVRYQYEVLIGGDPSNNGSSSKKKGKNKGGKNGKKGGAGSSNNGGYYAIARGDIDRNSIIVEWTVTESSPVPSDDPEGEH